MNNPMLKYLNNCIRYNPSEQREVALIRLNGRDWDVELCAINNMNEPSNSHILGVFGGVFLFFFFGRRGA